VRFLPKVAIGIFAGAMQCVPAVAAAAGPATVATAAPSLAARAARFPAVRAARASFEQEREVSLVEEVVRARGSIALRAPDTMRLDLTEPESLTLVATGSRVTVLDANGATVPLPPEASGLADFARELTALLLTGRPSAPVEERWDGPDAVTLVPQAGRGPFAEIALRFPSDAPVPREIVLRERGGDHTTIRLRGLQLEHEPADDRTTRR
jgi:outer membrane lipoprotein-sorting protein